MNGITFVWIGSDGRVFDKDGMELSGIDVTTEVTVK